MRIFQKLIGGLVAFVLLAGMATAQDESVFIQVEARTSLNGAQQGVNEYSAKVPDVNGFSLGGGWYGVAIGPYSRTEAQRLMVDLQRRGLIPADAYIEGPDAYGRQFWPVGAQVLDDLSPRPSPDIADPVAAAPPVATTLPAPVPAQTAPEPVADPIPEPEELEETPRQARASEAALTRDERKELQVALKWAGVYTSGIDGAFGRGTRRAMSDWQAQNGFDTTGVLTTRQRATLFSQYNAILEGMGMANFFDPRSGIALQLPLGAIEFDRYEAPFALFKAKGDPAIQVLLISQPGDRKTMNGLYEIMQTLEIVPLDGARKRDSNGFVLTGENARIVSHTEVGLRNNEIKGFTLIWPAGDEERRSRVLGLMQSSWERIDGVLDPGSVTDDGQAVDLVSGLKVRKPRANASGFFVDNAGTVLTSAATVAGCSRVTLDGVFEAEVVARDDALGVAALRPKQTLSPRSVAAFRTDTPRLQSEVAVAGYSFGGRLSAPTLTFGSLEDLQGLNGEANIARLELAALPGDAGGPVFDGGGLVVGMMQDRSDASARRLPEDVSFVAKSNEVMTFLRSAGVRMQTGGGISIMAAEDLTALAADTTVLVSCWE